MTLKLVVRTRILRVVASFFGILMVHHAQSQPQSTPATTRDSTVIDSIEMTQLADETSPVPRLPAVFSPDRQKFAVVTCRGNLTKNSNDYSILLFRSADAFRTPKPELLLKRSSLSNDPAISDVQWRPDNRTILLLGQDARKIQQVYALNVLTKKINKLTHHTTDVVAFDTSADASILAYLARPNTPTLDATARKRGLVISDERLDDLLSGDNSRDGSIFARMLLEKRGSKRPIEVGFPAGESIEWAAGLSVSPNGKYVIVFDLTDQSSNPGYWAEYENPLGQESRQSRQFLAYRIVDTRTRVVRPLIDAPLSGSRVAVVWSSDGRWILLSGTRLPLNVQDPGERELRKKASWVVALDIQSGALTKIIQGDFAIDEWDPKTNTIILRAARNTGFSGSDAAAGQVAFQKIGEMWAPVAVAIAEKSLHQEPGVREEQEMNSPPRLFAVNKETGQKSLLMDLNPQFAKIHFGHVEEVAFRTIGGKDIKGGLYLPPRYSSERQYPLVIQTHDWNSSRFQIDGYATAGYAAQALAAAGFVVAQLPMAEQIGTPNEGPENMAIFEGLIDELDRRALIDRTRVGLLGFSRTGYHVRYTLAFSKYQIAAAVVADGLDGGYLQYALEANGKYARTVEADLEGHNGGVPFGAGIQGWLTHAPAFNLDRIHTPIRQLGFGPSWFVYNWEAFVGLKRLGKPIEMLWLPESAHRPVRPAERLAAQQGDVDWFRFWLQNYEDPNPEKKEQNARWLALRAQRDALSTKTSDR